MYYLIIGILLFAIYGSFMLSRRDYRKKNICPKVLGIPACYLVVLFFVATLIAQVSGFKIPYTYYAYFGFMAVPFLLALTGTLTELSGKVICPRTAGGTPMCYLSLGLCTLLLTLNFFSV